MGKKQGSIRVDQQEDQAIAYGVVIDGAVYGLEGQSPTGTPVLGPITKVSN